ncbi:MAG: Protein translocase subunit SecE [Chlamydiae bacterium]|nr:Protein translocase subunit SecE [Chlamydiota bacterium]
MTVSQKVTDLRVAKRKRAMRLGFFREMKEEMKMVSWTTREELRLCGKIVIGAIFALGLGIYLVDLTLRLFLSGTGNLVRLIGA